MKFPTTAVSPAEFFCYSGPNMAGDPDNKFGNTGTVCTGTSTLACPNAHMNDAAFSAFLVTLGGTLT